MKTFIHATSLLSLSLAFACATAKESPATQIKAKNLFIIVADGIRYDDALGNKTHLYAENIWNKLRPLGTICVRFYNSELTYPIPAQASLLTGTWDFSKNPFNDTLRPTFPTLFEYWKKKEFGDCYFAANKKNFKFLSYSNCKDFGKDYAPVFDTVQAVITDKGPKKNATGMIENAIYEKALSSILSNHPSFIYLNVDSGRGDEAELLTHDCKIKDKQEGCGGADLINAYYESIIITDTLVADLWNRIQRDSIYKENSIFVFLSAHGRHTDDFRGFGDKCQGCQQLNFLIIGPGVKKGFISKRKRTLIDICPTVGALFDLPTPYAKGDIMKEILE